VASSSVPRLDRALRDALREALPHANLEAVTVLGEGWNATAWRLPHPGGDWVARVPKLEWAAAETERQSCLYPRLREHGLPFPAETRVLWGPDGSLAAGLHRYAPGAPVDAARNVGARRARLAEDIAAFLTRLHRVPASEALACGAAEFDAWHDHYRRLVARALDSPSPRSRAWLDTVAGRLAKAARPATARVVVHGDLSPFHLLLDDRGRLVTVLDMAGPFITDPAYDFSRLVQHFGVPFAELVLRHYGCEVDGSFRERMVLYDALRPTFLIDVGRERGLPDAVARGHRQIAARAAAATRAGELAP
jgi:aminoglycoside phosphotransferase (APT) family kinase protein